MKGFKAWLHRYGRLLISLTGVACIPLIYAGLLISANSDPTGRLHDVPALVVNLDRAAKTSTGESVDLGPRIVDELQDSHDSSNLHWTEASKADADAALADGSALAVLTIPEGFSAAAASAGDDDPMKAHAGQLQVRTNDASNYLMGTIAKAVGNEVTDSVRTQVSEEYLKNIYVGFNDVHSSLVDAADGATQLADGTTTAKDGSGSLVVGLNKLKDGSAQLDAGAVKLASGAGTLSTGAGTLSDGLNELASKTKDLPAQSKALNDGAQKLSAGTAKVDDAASQLASGAKKANDGAQQLSGGAAKVDDAAGKLAAGSRQVADGTQQLSDTASQIAGSVTDVSNGTQETLGALGTLLEDTTGISSATRVDVSGTASQAKADLDKLLSDPAVQAAIKNNPKLAALQDSLNRDLPAVAKGAKATQDAIEKAQKAAGLVQDRQGTSIDDLIADAKKVSAAAQTLKDKTAQLNGGAQQVASGNEALAKSTPALKDGASSLAAGTKQLADGTSQLAQSTPALKDGASQLAAGTKALNSAVPTLSGAIKSAAAGGDKLAAGASDLSTGAHTLAGGTGSLVDGTSQAGDGATKLDSGLNKLQDGAGDLKNGLDDGVGQVPSYSDQDKEHLSSVNADPVSMDKTSVNSMANYGTGLSPYFLSLALWIGGIAFFMLMAPLPAKLLARRLPAPLTALRAYVPAAIMAVVQASIAVAVVLFVLKIDVAAPLQMWLLAMFASLAFVALNQGLVAMLGAPGRFISLIMVVLQVGTAGGTYPWQTLPSALQAVHPWLPMSYTVESFRSMVAGGPLIGVGAAYGVLAIYLAIGLVLLTVAAFIAPRRANVFDTATLAPGLPGGGRHNGPYSLAEMPDGVEEPAAVSGGARTGSVSASGSGSGSGAGVAALGAGAASGAALGGAAGGVALLERPSGSDADVEAEGSETADAAAGDLARDADAGTAADELGEAQGQAEDEAAFPEILSPAADTADAPAAAGAEAGAGAEADADAGPGADSDSDDTIMSSRSDDSAAADPDSGHGRHSE